MLARGPGTFSWRVRGDLDYACVSASAPSELRAWLDDEEVEHVYVGPYSPHTWWLSNSLLGRAAAAGGERVLRVTLGPAAVLRVEGDLERL